MKKSDSELTIEQLKLKATDKGRMPSIASIHYLLEEKGIKHSFDQSVNIVEYRSKGRRYVNSRHRGKEGYKIEIKEPEWLCLDTSDSYYSSNSWSYARKILELIEKGENNEPKS